MAVPYTLLTTTHLRHCSTHLYRTHKDIVCMQLQSILQLGPNIQTHIQDQHTHQTYSVQKQPVAANTILPTIDIAADTLARSAILAFSCGIAVLSMLP